MSSLIVEVCKVLEVSPHPNADKLDIITVKGWNCIVGRNQFQVGDVGVFIPPDCILPNDMIEEYNLSYLKKNGRTGTVKLRGSISQGIFLPVNFPVTVGEDLSAYFGITKYEQPEPQYNMNSGGKIVSKKKINPMFDKYTDIENIKHYPDVFRPDDIVVITEKLHGTNARFGNLPIVVNSTATIIERLSAWFRKVVLGKTHEFVWGSHNVQKGVSVNKQNYYGDDVWGRVANKYSLKDKLPNGYIFYGEIVGQGIQDLTYGLATPQLFIFDIKNVETGEYLDWDLVEEWCYHLDLPIVPTLGVGRFGDCELDYYTGGNSTLYPKQVREGCVVKSYEEENERRIGRKILKSINPEYLLRKEGTEFK